MPENFYFRQPETQRMLLDILFVFCKLNPDVGYRQGMHELLAPILWVVERDAIDLGPSSKAHGDDAVIRAVYDAEHVEHDSFALFSQVMHSAKNFYEQTTHSGSDNPMVLRSRRIFNELLPQVDTELSQHLNGIDIVPQVFLMRWIRLLFGREFSFDDTLTVWDVIFAEDTSLELVDHICLAMLLRIRWELLDADYNTALTLLLRYPEPDTDHPAQTFALDALYLREHMTTEGSGYLILKYTGRPLQPLGRPTTPPALLRNITTFSGANVTRASAVRSGLSPPQLSRQRSNIEAIMQSTAKNIYARGEKFGIGKAVRNAVDEVHKRAQEIRDTQTPSLPPRPARGGYGALCGRVKALEERNKQLSKLLEGAVGELWDYQKLAVERREGSAHTATPDIEQLSVAVAKVQFIQVYLADPSLPLPEESAEPESLDREGADKSGTGDDRHQETTPHSQEGWCQPPATSAAQSTPPDVHMGALADPSSFEEADSLRLTPPIEQPAEPAGQENSPGTVRRDTANLLTPRPALAESSYSWILGQCDTQAQPFSTSATSLPEHSRSKGSLFGEGNGDKEGSRKVGRGTGRDRKQKANASEVTEEDAFDLSTLRRSRGQG